NRTLLVVSLPASDIEVGGERGREALNRLSNAIGRVDSPWRPASAEEGGSGPKGEAAKEPARRDPGESIDPEDLPPALRLFWEEHPYVTEDEIRSLANISWCGRRPFTPTDYWVLHQVLSGMLRDT
ncbi:MAG: hypothetical protein LOD90_10255, partial [Symbiobacteriaceae bacterium]